MGTFVQSSVHGNLGYIGFAVCYYLLGEEGLTRASILSGFMMCLQNLLAVLALQIFSGNGGIHKSPWFFIKRILGNPVILSAVAGMLFLRAGNPNRRHYRQEPGDIEQYGPPSGPAGHWSLHFSRSHTVEYPHLFSGWVLQAPSAPRNRPRRLFTPWNFTETACTRSDPFGLPDRNHHLYHGRRDERLHQPGIFGHFPEHAPFGFDFFLLALAAPVKFRPRCTDILLKHNGRNVVARSFLLSGNFNRIR